MPTATAAADRAALAAALHPIITIDSLGVIQSASNSLQRVFGWTPEELVGRNVSMLMPEPNRSGHDGYLQRYRDTGRTNILNRPRRFEAMRKDGTVFPMELSVSRADVPGHAPLFVGIIRDMSEQAASEQGHELDRARLQNLVTVQTEALQAAHLRLRMADRLASIGTLAAGLGHDMNNVLLPVRARLNALRAEGEALPASAREHLEDIRKSIAYLQQLADGLHYLAMDPETEDDSTAVTDLQGWWSQTGALLAKAVPKHVQVVASIPPNLHAAVEPHRLTQAVLNLVVNAGEAIPGPGESKRRPGQVKIWAERSADGAWVRLGVSDNGRGMSAEVKRRAFEMFFTTKVRGMGTGLGLALVHKVAVGAGGTVEVESETGTGTTVILRLRAAAAENAGSVAPGVLVALADGRADALVKHILAECSVRFLDPSEWGEADLSIVDCTADALAFAQKWRKSRARGGLVVLGTPAKSEAAAWAALTAIIIKDRNDFEEVRAAIGRAVAVLPAGGR